MFSGVEHLQLWLKLDKTSRVLYTVEKSSKNELWTKRLNINFILFFFNIYANSFPLKVLYAVALLFKCFNSNLLFYMLKAKLKSQPCEFSAWEFSGHVCGKTPSQSSVSDSKSTAVNRGLSHAPFPHVTLYVKGNYTQHFSSSPLNNSVT